MSPLLGVLVGGYLTELVGWRMLFVAQLLLGFPALIAGFVLPAQKPEPSGPFDVQGSIAAALTAGSLLAATTWLGQDARFTQRSAIALAVTWRPSCCATGAARVDRCCPVALGARQCSWP